MPLTHKYMVRMGSETLGAIRNTQGTTCSTVGACNAQKTNKIGASNPKTQCQIVI